MDLVVPVAVHRQVRDALAHVTGYQPSAAEPSVWLPDDPQRLEINFIGCDPSMRETSDSYVLEDPSLPLLVFGLLGFLRQGATIEASGVRATLPRPAGLLAEKLLTERAGLKGERDLLVALGLLIQCNEADLIEVTKIFQQLSADARTMLLGNLAVLSLMQPLPDMPDPTRGRTAVEDLLTRLQAVA